MANRQNSGEPKIEIKDGPAPEPKVRKPRAKRVAKEVTDDQVERLHSTVVLLLNGVFIFAPDRYKPTREEIDSIMKPAERIYLRHADVPDVSDDFRDGMLLIMGLSGYTLRVAGIAAMSNPQPSNVPPPPSRAPQSVVPDIPTNGASRSVEEEIRFARPGESTGLSSEDLQGPPEDVMSALHRAAYTEDTAVDLSPLREEI